jgi:hypothetical protein
MRGLNAVLAPLGATAADAANLGATSGPKRP